ncbi:hypothetical protein [Nocardioides campestrisoli]|uniref:hypothetical protein n=1 Tax=Nocardioides campestrisoli TaxID=2736757 RepID=UPI00163D6A02|nr:hypothetical protein [Nocardioides campestrisoli]
MRRTRPSTRTALAATAVLATTLTTVLAGAPTGTAASPALPAPAWQSSWTAQGDPWDADVHLVDSVLDPVSGDLFAVARNSEVSDDHLVRRVDGLTGATEWEVPMELSQYSQLTIDAEARQLVISHPVPGQRKQRVRLSAFGLDGEPRWTRDLGSFGHVRQQVTDPVRGTTCILSATKGAGTGDQGGLGQRWELGCATRAGGLQFRRDWRRSGVTAQDRVGLAIDPRRGRWYVAVGRVVRNRSSAVELQALGLQGGTRWHRTLSWGPRSIGSVGALTVDPKRGRVVLGTAVDGDRVQPRTTLTVWNADGRRHAQRTWRPRLISTIDDLAVSPDGKHYVVASLLRTSGGTLRGLRPDLSHRWTTRHTRKGVEGIDLVIDEAKRRVLVAGGELSAYRWRNGSRLWRGVPGRDYVGAGLHFDPERRRLVASWWEGDWPVAHLTAWQV